MPASNFNPDLVPDARTFFERELGPLRPAGRDRATANCPFHRSKSGRSFSVDMARGLWYCHGCGFGGDIIKFVMRRDHCSFKTACQSLGCWRDMSADDRLAATRREQERAWNRQRELERQASERSDRLAIREELHTAVRLYQRIDGELHEIGPQAEEHWSALPYLLDDWRLTESHYCGVARLENPYE